MEIGVRFQVFVSERLVICRAGLLRDEITEEPASGANAFVVAA